MIPQVKTLDDLWPHIGLDPGAYGDRQDMLIVHGHQFDFWNCDEHNRVGKFITNAAAIPTDALGDVVYDWRGIDRLGHPLLDLRDALGPITPMDSWPPQPLARTWAEAIEQRVPRRTSPRTRSCTPRRSRLRWAC